MNWMYSTIWLLCVSVCEFWVPVSSAVIDCGEPELLLNGGVTLISGSQNQYLSVIQYHCNEPFYSLPKGANVNFTCSSDGKWKADLSNSVIPQCIPVCGRPTVNLPGFGRIFGGNTAPAGSFPWLVLVNVNGREGGAVIVGNRWIMTAAQVLDKHRWDEVRVYVGVNNVEDLIQSPPLEVASLHLHPQYNNTDGVEYEHDIALIHLKHPITFNAHIMPLCLPAKDAKYPTGRIGLVSGFDMANIDLMYVPLPVVNQTLCRTSIEGRDKRKGSLTDNMVCAGNPEGGKDSCTGESGGAYALKEGDHFWAAGIASWGINCGEPGRYGVYTRVANYLDWIKNTIVDRQSGYCKIPDTSSDEALQLVDKDPSTLLFRDEVQFKCESKYYTLEGDEKYICDSDGIWRSVNGLEKLPKCIAVCGKPETDISSIGRILGGRPAKIGEIPWQLLTKHPKRGGASLISDRWAITAAHVVDGYEESSITFFGGLIDGAKAYAKETDVVVMVTEKIIIHPDYMKGVDGNERTNYDNDIALIRMSSRVRLGPNVLPICLPEADGGFKEGQQGTVAGWGATENQAGTKMFDKSRFLRHTAVGRYSQNKCEDTPLLSSNKPMVFTENMFCAGGDEGDSCKGDGGSPFFLPKLGSGNKGNRGPYRLRGIVSWGTLCELGKDSKKGYYTKVDNYLDWIKKTIEIEEQQLKQLLGVSVCEFWVPVSSAVIGCGEPEPLLNGQIHFISGSQNQHLSVIQYHCNEPFYSLPKGANGNFTCLSDGKWKDCLNSSLIPQCIPVCGRPTVNLPGFGRILGGNTAPAGSFPWQVLVNVNGRAGGAVIGDRWIMTAAQVLDKHRWDEVRVYVGSNNVQNLIQSPPLEVASLHLHPQYNNTEYDHDIALIHLKHPITFNAHIMPLCLPAKDAKYPTGQIGLISGFGVKEVDMPTHDLMYVPLPVVNQTLCRTSIEGRDKRKGVPSLTDNMVCAGNPEGGKDSCTGDSGGAYALKKGDNFWAAGIVSWGINCGEPGRYGVYTRVVNYLDWIKKIIEEEEQKTICGRPMVSIEMHQRILGGEVVPKGTFPWQVLLSVEGGRSGGMVIGDKWILTAAHGLVYKHNHQVIKKSEVMAYVGDNNVGNLLQSPPLEVASLYPHPRYNNTDGLSFNHDIALIKLQHPLTFSSSIMRVCLPAKGAEYSTGRVGWVSGFGLKDDDEMTSNLRYVRIPLVDQVKCRNSIDEVRRKKKRESPDLTDNMFCAGLPEGGKGTCAGDGGGPYVLKYGGVFWAAGIASWGIDCGEPGQYGVYTRVANYVEWIKNTMEEN